MIRDIPAGGSRISLIVGETEPLFVCISHPTLPNSSFIFFFFCPHFVSNLGVFNSSTGPTWCRMPEMQWQSCRKENEFSVLINHQSDLLCFSFFFFFPFIFKGENELINTNLEQVFYRGVLLFVVFFLKATLIYCT